MPAATPRIKSADHATPSQTTPYVNDNMPPLQCHVRGPTALPHTSAIRPPPCPHPHRRTAVASSRPNRAKSLDGKRQPRPHCSNRPSPRAPHPSAKSARAEAKEARADEGHERAWGAARTCSARHSVPHPSSNPKTQGTPPPRSAHPRAAHRATRPLARPLALGCDGARR